MGAGQKENTSEYFSNLGKKLHLWDMTSFEISWLVLLVMHEYISHYWPKSCFFIQENLWSSFKRLKIDQVKYVSGKKDYK